MTARDPVLYQTRLPGISIDGIFQARDRRHLVKKYKTDGMIQNTSTTEFNCETPRPHAPAETDVIFPKTCHGGRFETPTY